VRKPFPVLLLFVLALICTTSAWAWTGKVVAIADGDTVTVLNSDMRQVKIRLYGVDAPERSQSFGSKAKQFTAEQVFGRQVEVLPVDQDRYGRTVGMVLYDGRNLSEELVRKGLAWVYSQYCKKPECRDWVTIEETARVNRTGLWADSEAVAPWTYRKGGNDSQPKAEPSPTVYHGNIKSQKFHRPSCRNFDCEHCTAIFKSREEAIRAGFEPCGICNP